MSMDKEIDQKKLLKYLEGRMENYSDIYTLIKNGQFDRQEFQTQACPQCKYPLHVILERTPSGNTIIKRLAMPYEIEKLI